MFTNDGYALLIGVDDYSTFDDARNKAPGTSDLGGSRNDVRAFWRLCRRLGIKPVNIRVLTSPPLDYRELEGASPETVGQATEAEILVQTRWLAARLSHASQPTGLLTYSGHGDTLDGEGLVLCPSDVSWVGRDGGAPNISHAVPLRKLDALFAGCADNLTVVLDTCHAGHDGGDPHTPGPAGHGGGDPEPVDAQAQPTGRPLTLTGRDPSSLSPEKLGLSGRVLAATRHHQVAYQATLDGQPRGVFSWALTTAMEQWKATPEGNAVRLDLSYGKLTETATRLMSALWFDQTPELHGPAGLADLAVFHPGPTGHPGETRDKPNGDFKTRQVDPGNKDWLVYTVQDVNSNVLAYLLVIGATGSGSYTANTEYWYIKTNLSNSSAVTFVPGTPTSWPTTPSGLGTLTFQWTTSTSWTSGTLSATIPNGTSSSGVFVAMDWGMHLVKGGWAGTVTWWNGNSSGTILSSTASTTLTPSAASGTYNSVTV